jgi:hypothetical protein
VEQTSWLARQSKVNHAWTEVFSGGWVEVFCDAVQGSRLSALGRTSKRWVDKDGRGLAWGPGVSVELYFYPSLSCGNGFGF